MIVNYSDEDVQVILGHEEAYVLMLQLTTMHGRFDPNLPQTPDYSEEDPLLYLTKALRQEILNDIMR